MTKFLIFFGLLIILIFGGLLFLSQFKPDDTKTADVVSKTPKLLNRVLYMCNDTKTIDASFYERPATTSPSVGEAPISNGYVDLILSDGRTFNLSQTVATDGARFANANEQFVFWSKGNGAMVLEAGAEKSYIGCVRIAPVTVGATLPSIYASTEGSFSLRLPSLANATADGYSVDESFKNVQSPELSIDGVKFTIPKALASGTNLSQDTYLSVEHIPEVVGCTADLFFDGTQKNTPVVDAGVTYSVATSSGAGAGNRYEDVVYALQGSNPCVAVRYMVHYGALENYATTSSSTIKAFNSNALLAQFDQIRRTLIVNQ